MKPLEISELRIVATDQAKSTDYFMQLRGWPEFDLNRPVGNGLIVSSKTVPTNKLLVSLDKAGTCKPSTD